LPAVIFESCNIEPDDSQNKVIENHVIDQEATAILEIIEEQLLGKITPTLQAIIAMLNSVTIIKLSFVIKDPTSPPKDTLPSNVNILKAESIPGLKAESMDKMATAPKNSTAHMVTFRIWIMDFDLYKVAMKTDIHMAAGINPKPS
jgi:hypothetical protein